MVTLKQKYLRHSYGVSFMFLASYSHGISSPTRSDLVLLQSDVHFTELYLAKTASLVSLWPKGYYNQGDRHKFCHLTCCLHLVLYYHISNIPWAETQKITNQGLGVSLYLVSISLMRFSPGNRHVLSAKFTVGANSPY